MRFRGSVYNNRYKFGQYKMNKYRVSSIIIFLLVFSSLIQASEDDLFPTTKIKIENGSHPQTGEVSAIIETDNQDITSFTAFAFGKEFKLEKQELTKLAGFTFLSIAVTHSASYEKLGGHTVNYNFIHGYGLGNRDQKKENAVVFVTNENGISVFNYEDPN